MLQFLLLPFPCVSHAIKRSLTAVLPSSGCISVSAAVWIFSFFEIIQMTTDC